MKETLVVLLVIGILMALTAVRYRRQIATGIQIWKMLRGASPTNRGERDLKGEPVAKGPLVVCSKCGTWVPGEKAIRLGQNAVYCSAQCLETAARN
ncbi:MAG: hypothetical protein ABI539_02570 [Acidobacteriota bacterium]